MDVCHALADLGVSINLIHLSIWKKHSLMELTPTRMTLELADRSITHPKGLAGDIFVKVGNFHFPTDFVVLILKRSRVPLITGRSFLRTPFKKFTDEPALVCLPPSEDVNNKKEKQEVNNLAESTVKRQTRITPCLKNFRVVCKESRFHSNKTPQVSLVFVITSALPSIEPKDSLIMRDEHLSTFSTEEIIPIPKESEDTSGSDNKNVFHSCDISSINVSTCDFVTFLTLFSRDDIEFLFHHDPSKSVASILEGFIDDPPFEENDDLFDLECKTNDWKGILYDAPIDEAECFDPGGDNDEIDAFLAIEVPTYIEGYYDSEGDVLYLESLLSEDTTHNLSPEVFFDHEPQQLRNEPENEPLITFSPKSDPLHHEFTGELITIPPDDSIPPGIKSDFDSKEDIIDNLLNNDSTHERLTFNIEPDAPVINNVDELNEDECFDPGGSEINVEVDNSFTFVTWIFLPYLTYPEVSPLLSSTKNEDTIFDPGIST
ncbi:reverse transcriptase domain-containing protein [Tanacetum coccineum]